MPVRALSDRWGLLAQQGRRGRLARKGNLARREREANKEYKVNRVNRASRAARVQGGRKANRGYKESRVSKAYKETVAARAHKGQLGPVGPGASADFADLVASVKDSVVKIKDPEVTTFTTGTGFFIAPSCSIVTARHVVEERDSDRLMSNLIAELQDGQVVRVSVSYDLKAKDLIVLRPTRSIECQELPLSDDTARLGQLVLILGFPNFWSSNDLSITPGHVANVNGTSLSDFLVMGTINYGSSGSPVLNVEGEVVGMVGGSLGYETDDDGNYIHDYSPITYAYDIAKHLQ